jgi:phage terminase large subunit GpA-like protein
MTGANAPASLASRPIRVVLCDEVDRFPASAGQEGDPVGLAEKRTTTFWNRKIGLVSTPTIKGVSRIEASYLEGDQRKFHGAVPALRRAQELVWAGVKWENGDPTPPTMFARRPTRTPAKLLAARPGPNPTAWTRSARPANGGWVATKPFKGHASFHASQLASKRVPLHRVVKEFLDAKPYPERLKQWVNTVLAETWEEGGEKVDPDSLYARREDYDAAEELPERVGLITAGVDIQDNRWECEIVGWGAHEERWSLDYTVFMADPSTPDYWEKLDEHLQRTFQHPTGATLKIEATCVDSGGHHTQAVYEFCRARSGRRVLRSRASPALIGRSGRKRPPGTGQKDGRVDGGRRPGKSGHGKAAHGDRARAGLLPLSALDVYDEAYFDGLTVEKCITKFKHGRPFKVWECPEGKRNEPWDNAVYAYAAFKATPIDIAARLRLLQQAAAAGRPTRTPRHAPGAPRGRRVRSQGATA